MLVEARSEPVLPAFRIPPCVETGQNCDRVWLGQVEESIRKPPEEGPAYRLVDGRISPGGSLNGCYGCLDRSQKIVTEPRCLPLVPLEGFSNFCFGFRTKPNRTSHDPSWRRSLSFDQEMLSSSPV